MTSHLPVSASASPASVQRAAHAIVIGASAGGVGPLLELVRTLPRDLDAVIGIVLHIGFQKSILPELLRKKGAASAAHAKEVDPID